VKVFDASALVEYLTDGRHADAVYERIDATSSWLWAPQLIDAEVGHSLRRVVRAGEISARVARTALAEMMDMRLMRIDHRLLLDRAWALRDNLSFYDGLYVALAEELGAPLVTLDARLAAAPGLKVEVDVIQAS
jgi:predicted nucleic acid-binding protein